MTRISARADTASCCMKICGGGGRGMLHPDRAPSGDMSGYRPGLASQLQVADWWFEWLLNEHIKHTRPYGIGGGRVAFTLLTRQWVLGAVKNFLKYRSVNAVER